MAVMRSCVMTDYVPSPTFSEKIAAKTTERLEEKKLPPFPDCVRSHRLPLVLKSRNGDSLQVYLISYAKKDESGLVVYDVEFDDRTKKENVARTSLSIPPATSYQIMRLQESQEVSKTPPPRSKRQYRSSQN